jgi:hypothetical protein
MVMLRSSSRLMPALLVCLCALGCGGGGSSGAQPDAGGGPVVGPDGGSPAEGAPGGPVNGGGAGGGGGGSGGGGGGGNPPISPITIPGVDQHGAEINEVQATLTRSIEGLCPDGGLCVNTRVEGGGTFELEYCRFDYFRVEGGEIIPRGADIVVKPGATIVLVTGSRADQAANDQCGNTGGGGETPPTGTPTPPPEGTQPPPEGGQPSGGPDGETGP